MNQVLVQEGKFNDSDEWCRMAEGWNLRFQQLDKGPLQAEMVRALTPDLVIQKVSMSRRFHQSGSAPDGLLTFGLVVEPHLHRWLGRELKSSSILNFSRSDGYESVSEPRFHGQTISIPTISFLEDCAAIGGGEDVEQALNGREEFLVSQRGA